MLLGVVGLVARSVPADATWAPATDGLEWVRGTVLLGVVELVASSALLSSTLTLADEGNPTLGAVTARLPPPPPPRKAKKPI